MNSLKTLSALFVLLFVAVANAVPNVKISELLTATTITTNDLTVLVSSGSTRKASLGSVLDTLRPITPPAELASYSVYGLTNTVVYVAPYGNDTTGVRGDVALPFATIAAAIAAAQNNDVVFLANGTYTLTGAYQTLKDGLSIVGQSRSGVLVEITQQSGAPVAGFVLTNNVTLANFRLKPAGAANGYDTYPLYSSVLPLSMSAQWSSNSCTNVFLYNLDVSGFSDAIFIRNWGKISATALKCDFSSYFDAVLISSSTTNAAGASVFKFTDCKFKVIPEAPYYRGWVPCRGIAACGVDIYTERCSFTVKDGNRFNSLESRNNVALQVASFPPPYFKTSFTASQNVYDLSSTNVASKVFEIYTGINGTQNTEISTFYTDNSAPKSAVSVNPTARIVWTNPDNVVYPGSVSAAYFSGNGGGVSNVFFMQEVGSVGNTGTSSLSTLSYGTNEAIATWPAFTSTSPVLTEWYPVTNTLNSVITEPQKIKPPNPMFEVVNGCQLKYTNTAVRFFNFAATLNFRQTNSASASREIRFRLVKISDQGTDPSFIEYPIIRSTVKITANNNTAASVSFNSVAAVAPGERLMFQAAMGAISSVIVHDCNITATTVN